jgi:hypothetical protein
MTWSYAMASIFTFVGLICCEGCCICLTLCLHKRKRLFFLSNQRVQEKTFLVFHVQQLTWQALRYADAPQGTPRIIRKDLQSSCPENKSSIDAGAPQAPPDTVGAKEPEKPHSTDKYKDRVNTLLLVATLVATVTFAAAFTMPGGYDGSGGVATFIEKHMFQVFVICNTIAMYSAITVVIALIWAQLDDLELLNAALKITVPILGLALTMVCVAFMAGNYLVLRNLNWLAYLVLIIGSFFLLILSILFLPLCFPTSVHHVIPRCIIHYPFLLLIILFESVIDDKKEE